MKEESSKNNVLRFGFLLKPSVRSCAFGFSCVRKEVKRFWHFHFCPNFGELIVSKIFQIVAETLKHKEG